MGSIGSSNTTYTIWPENDCLIFTKICKNFILNYRFNLQINNLIVADALLPVMAERLHDLRGLGVAAESRLLGLEVLLDEHLVLRELAAGALLALVLAGTARGARFLEGTLLGHTHLTHLAGRAEHFTDSRLRLGASLLPHCRDGTGELGERSTGHRDLDLLPVHLTEVGIGIGAAGHRGLLGHLADGFTHRLTHRLTRSRARAADRFTAHGLLRCRAAAHGLLRCRAAAGSGALGGLGTRYTRTSCHFSINEKNKKKFFIFLFDFQLIEISVRYLKIYKSKLKFLGFIIIFSLFFSFSF
jgi:hypothetical protein